MPLSRLGYTAGTSTTPCAPLPPPRAQWASPKMPGGAIWPRQPWQRPPLTNLTRWLAGRAGEQVEPQVHRPPQGELPRRDDATRLAAGHQAEEGVPDRLRRGGLHPALAAGRLQGRLANKCAQGLAADGRAPRRRLPSPGMCTMQSCHSNTRSTAAQPLPPVHPPGHASPRCHCRPRMMG